MTRIKRHTKKYVLRALFLLGVLVLSPKTFIQSLFNSQPESLSHSADALFGVDIAHGDTPPATTVDVIWIADGPPATGCGTGGHASAGTMSDGNTANDVTRSEAPPSDTNSFS